MKIQYKAQPEFDLDNMLSTDFNFMSTEKMQATLQSNLEVSLANQTPSKSSNHSACNEISSDSFIFIVENMNKHIYSTLLDIIDENENANRTFSKNLPIFKKYFAKYSKKNISEDFNSLLHFNGSCTDVILLKDLSSLH